LRRIAIAGVLVVVAVLVAAQFALPAIAAARLRSQLSRFGTVERVSVKAFPAVELLWHRADHITVALRSYRAPGGQFGDLLTQSIDVGSLDASADDVQLGLLTVHDARLHKRGAQLTAAGRISEADLRAAVPFLEGVVPVASAGGALTLRGTATALGLSASADATVAARDGELVLAPDVPFGGLATVALFADPRLEVEQVGGAPAPGGFSVYARGRLN
jgi:hypothetical protein